jgi:hypothetical protein
MPDYVENAGGWFLKYKLVVIDLDGTLVDRDGKIAEEDRDSVERLTRNFVTVSVCTGRILKTAAPFVESLKLRSPQILFDGALIYSFADQGTLYSVPLKPDVVQEAITYCRAHNAYLELYSRDVFFAERENWSDEIHRNFFRVEPTFVNFDGIWEREKLLKAELVVHSDEDARKAKLFSDHFQGRFNFSIARTPAYPDVEFLNIVDPGVSKGNALRFLASEMGVYPTEIIAIGDGTNDIPLLKEAGNAVAMGDAPDEVKQVCHYTTLDVEHHGVAAAINYFFPS